MKTVDYINSLIKENSELKALCKDHVEKNRYIKREIVKLNSIIAKKDKKIQDLEGGLKIPDEEIQRELDDVKRELSILKEEYNDLQQNINNAKPQKSSKVKNELNSLKVKYKDLQNRYNAVVLENEEYKRIFDDVEKDSD